MRKYFLVIAIACFLQFGCKESSWEYSSIDFYFKEPQPLNDSELSSIPKKFRGTFILGDSTLVVSEHLITSKFVSKTTEHKNILSDSVKEKFTYRNGKMFLEGIAYDVKKKNDSLYLTAVLSDTLFRFSHTQKAKRINGNLILSRKDSIFWKSNIISISKDSLKWRHLSSKEDYVSLISIVKEININKDTSVVHLNPTRREFNKILSIKKLGWNLRYKKIK